jgi:two-component system phosphate regulon sensor histidine kinase PhoR
LACNRALQNSNILLEDGMDGLRAIKQLIEALPEAVLLLESRDTVWFANAAARELLGVSQTQGATSRFLRAPDVVDALGLAAKGDIQKVRYRERVPFDRWIEAHVSQIDLRVEALDAALLVVLRDLTASERIERMRADFVANVSHELRTPLASLAGFIETLKGAARDDVEARQKFLDIMDSQAKRMARLISDLLALSRIELDEHIQPATKVDLVDIAASVIEALRPLAKKSAVALILLRDGPVRILGSSDELSRLIENLVDNAVKYGGSGGRVEIGVTRERDSEGEYALLRVRDFGSGIAPEHLPRLTERFYRVDAGESRAKGGTGLGLALVKHIVARHRGRLMVESSPGKGAQFSARFPLSM